MPDQPSYTGGGFAVDRDQRLPESLALRAELADEIDRRADVAAEREVRLRTADFASSSAAASVVDALERGEVFSMREAINAGGVGHTRSEFLARVSAEQDRADAYAAAVERAAFRKWQLDQAADASADTTAPTHDEVEAKELTASRAAAFRARRREQADTLRKARAIARMDRTPLR